MGFNNVDKLTATLFRPCNRFTIKHCVRVAYKDKMGNRVFHHKEYTYLNRSKYVDVKYLKSINLDFVGYILIEEQGKDWTERETISLYYRNLPIFIKTINKVASWFIDDEYDDLFYFEGGDLRFNVEFGNLKEIVALGENKSLMFKPTVIEDTDGTKYEGVEMYMNKSDCVGYIPIDNLMALKYIFNKFDLYQSSLELVNYLGRPEFDEFNLDLSREGEHNPVDNSFTKVSRRNNIDGGEMKNRLNNSINEFFK